MKEVRPQVTIICDGCDKEADYSYVCRVCGTEYCYECSKQMMIKYPCGVFHSGGKDGNYCNSCDIEYRASRKDPLHNWYLNIQDLRREYARFEEDFKKRYKEAEAQVEKLYK